MIDDRAVAKPLVSPAIAVAEDGLVILDGPGGLAVTLTPNAAAQTGQSLLDAAVEAKKQTS